MAQNRNKNEESGDRLIRKFGAFSRAVILSLLISQIFGWIYTKLLTNILAKSAYGLLVTLTSISLLMATFFSSLFGNSIWRYADKYGLSNKREIISGLIVVTVGTFCILTLAFFGVVAWLQYKLSISFLRIAADSYVPAFVFASLLSIANSLHSVVRSYSMAFQNSHLIITVAIVIGFLQVLAAGLSLIISRNPILVLGILGFLMLLGSFILLTGVLKSLPSPRLSLASTKKAFSFSSPLAFRVLFVSGVPTTAIYLASLFDGYSVSAVISIGFSVISIFVSIVQSIYTSFRQYAVSTYEREENENTRIKRIGDISVYILEMLIIGSFWVYLLAPEIVTFLSKSGYIESVIFIRIAIFGTLILWFGRIYGATANYVSERTSYETASSAFGYLLLLIFLLTWGRISGIVGIALSYVIYCITTGTLSIISGIHSFENLIPRIKICKISLSVVLCGLAYLGLIALGLPNVIAGIVFTLVFLAMQILLNIIHFSTLTILFPQLGRLFEKSSR